jgi:hypothetical protein
MTQTSTTTKNRNAKAKRKVSAGNQNKKQIDAVPRRKRNRNRGAETMNSFGGSLPQDESKNRAKLERVEASRSQTQRAANAIQQKMSNAPSVKKGETR